VTPEEFRAWLALMRAERGWRRAECARRLGVSPQSISNWAERGAPQHIGLAVSALMMHLPPWPIHPVGEVR
jgi:transcriptional regulator with XRE-family HTH domain